MRHRKKKNTLGKPADQRKALVKSLLVALINNEKIKTTHRRAKESSIWADRLVTLGKRGDIHSRRQAYKFLQDRKLVKKLFDDIAPRFSDVKGGYTRVVKVNNRHGDNATMSILEFTRIKEEIIEEKRKLKRMRREKKAKSMQQEVAPVVEEVKVEEEKVKKEVRKKENRVKEGKERLKEKPEQVKSEEKKGFLQGLTGFLKSKKEK